jgi:AraC-like DNA-binding protein
MLWCAMLGSGGLLHFLQTRRKELPIMLFAPKIRKDILNALEQSIIPALQTRTVPQFLAGPPFDFSGVEHWPIHEELLPDNDRGPLQIIRQWPELNMVASRGVNISFLYEGVMHKKVGICSGMNKAFGARKPPELAGIYAVKTSAPSVMMYSNFVAREDGTFNSLQKDDVSKTISITCERDEVWLFHSSRNLNAIASSHHLLVQDPLLAQLGHLYHQELQQQATLPGAQALLLAIMFRLQHHLVHTKPGISNSCWPDPGSEFEEPLSPTAMRHHVLCQNVIDYVQNHLHQPITIEIIAQRFDVSAFHLNRVFRQVHGTTVIHYVTELRISVAKKLLTGQNERISDIARLTGFSGTSSFCTVFRRHTGYTPNQFRKEYR